MKRTKLNLSYTHLTSLEMGKLVPFFFYDALPGDKVFLSNQSVHKAQPMVAPLMHKVDILTQYFFVPYRLIWNEWMDFITGGETGNATPVFPTIKATTGGFLPMQLADYFGLPIKQEGIESSALPFRAYTKIWNDHYKIDDIEEDKPLYVESGPDNDTNTTEVYSTHWKRDRFTRAKPFTQRGQQISVPVYPTYTGENLTKYAIYSITVTAQDSVKTKPTGKTYLGEITLTPKNNTSGAWRYDKNLIVSSFQMADGLNPNVTNGYITFKDNTKCSVESYSEVTIQWGNQIGNSQEIPSNHGLKIEAQMVNPKDCALDGTRYPTTTWELVSNIKISGNMYVLNSAVSAGGSLNIRDLRVATGLQKLQERSLKYGADYEEFCRMEFGVKIKDYRLQKSEYLGGSKSVLQISEVVQTTDTTSLPLGAQAGYGISQLKQRTIRYTCPEYGIIIGIASIRPDTLYTQGIQRELLKRQRFEYYTKELAGIGAQEIKQQEIFATKDNKDTVFGYDLNGNYREYYSRQSHASGLFRTDFAFWHLGRIFQAPPVLNASFIKQEPRKDIFAITDKTTPAFFSYFQNYCIAKRPIPRKIRTIL